ncbi:MAG TPA: HEPN domain-containing protein [Saprospiraceae bacterium]|nr:HEPN domain-containing protein [Saprospiraceae bacterium]HMU04417.1 HEPN domain-containing protein [Saprospiraceae bacterium]
MQILLDKSKANIDAAELLHQDEFYAPSVHCSYYSCIQLMRHLIFNKFGDDEKEFDERPEVKSSGSHNFLISFLRNKIQDPNKSRSFSDNIFRLKSHRINADYKQMNVLKSDSTTSISLAKTTRTILLNIN